MLNSTLFLVYLNSGDDDEVARFHTTLFVAFSGLIITFTTHSALSVPGRVPQEWWRDEEHIRKLPDG